MNRKQTGMRCGRELMGNWMRIFWYSYDKHVGADAIVRKAPSLGRHVHQ